MADMVSRVGGDWLRQPPGVTVHDAAVDLARHNSFRAKHRLQFRAGRHILSPVDVPHNLGELVVATENKCQISRPGRRAFWGERLASRGPLEHHGAIRVGHCSGCGKHSPATHTVAFKSDISFVDHGKTAQIFQPRRPSESFRKCRSARITMAGLVQRQDDVTAAGKFNCKTVLRLSAVDIAMNGKDTRRRFCVRGTRWDIK